MTLRRTDPVADQLVDLGVRRSAARRLSQSGTLLDLAPGTTLCQEGERGTQAFLVLDGTAQVHLPDGDVTIGAGDVVGELATLDQTRTRNATVVADSEVVVLVFDPQTYRSLARDEDLRDVLAPRRAAA